MNRKERPRNIAASVRARLTQRAHDRQENVQLALMRYAIERLLYRLGLSSHREKFVLKGAMLFSLWAPTPYRSTGDLDLLGFGDPAPERIVSVFREICLLAAADDGVVFNAETIRAQAARLEEEYSGIRLTLDAEIAGARLPLQIDIGFGDVVTPGIQDIDYPSLLGMPLPHLRAYATLRTDAREERVSRVRQIVDWLGSDFDGVIVFDESHSLANAAGGKGERGDQAPSQQGRAGLRLQHALPNARVVYVSATGATTVHNLAYAQRLGLWGGEDFPFATRSEFVQAIEAGGIAAMEVLARDLKALGLYAARSLSYEGVEYELVEHTLTPEQIRIYDAYAGAFQIIHNNLDAALQAANVTGERGTLNAQARSTARSAFESAKQRFFSHLITSMKTPTLIRAIERDLEAGHAAVIQIVSTGEALMERRLADIPTEEWGDVQVDITPREYVLCRPRHKT